MKGRNATDQAGCVKRGRGKICQGRLDPPPNINHHTRQAGLRSDITSMALGFRSWRIPLLLLAIIGAIFLGTLFWSGAQVQIGRDVSLSQCPISGLPSSAAHIDYVYGGFGPVKLYEFDATESD